MLLACPLFSHVRPLPLYTQPRLCPQKRLRRMKLTPATPPSLEDKTLLSHLSDYGAASERYTKWLLNESAATLN